MQIEFLATKNCTYSSRFPSVYWKRSSLSGLSLPPTGSVHRWLKKQIYIYIYKAAGKHTDILARQTTASGNTATKWVEMCMSWVILKVSYCTTPIWMSDSLIAATTSGVSQFLDLFSCVVCPGSLTCCSVTQETFEAFEQHIHKLKSLI